MFPRISAGDTDLLTPQTRTWSAIFWRSSVILSPARGSPPFTWQNRRRGWRIILGLEYHGFTDELW